MDIAKITNYIFVNTGLEKADLALLFGTRHQEAVAAAFDLYERKLAPKILISGGTNRVTGENEAMVIADKLISMGLNKIDIISDDKSTNTLENVLFSKEVIKKTIGWDNVNRIIVVVKNYHSRRVLMTVKKHFPEGVKLLVASYEICEFNKNNWFESDKGKEKVLGEYEKIQKYLAKGDITEL